jgi:hypothetical protein
LPFLVRFFFFCKAKKMQTKKTKKKHSIFLVQKKVWRTEKFSQFEKQKGPNLSVFSILFFSLFSKRKKAFPFSFFLSNCFFYTGQKNNLIFLLKDKYSVELK